MKNLEEYLNLYYNKTNLLLETDVYLSHVYHLSIHFYDLNETPLVSFNPIFFIK